MNPTLRFRQLVTLAGLTAVETLRRPLCLLLTTACVVLTVLTPMLTLHSFGEDGRLARDSGLAFHFVFGLLVAGYGACSSLSREMQSGTASAVLSKPVSRDVFFLAKFLGIAMVLAAFSMCAGAATLLSERVAEKYAFYSDASGYITDWRTAQSLLVAVVLAYLLAALLNITARRPFQSTAFGLLAVCLLGAFVLAGFFTRAGHWAPFDFAVQWRILPASMLVTAGLLVLAAIAAALATRLPMLPTLTLCLGLFFLGLMSDYLLGRVADRSLVAGVAYRLVPNWQHFWMPDALRDGGTIPVRYMLHTLGYAAAYAAGILALGVFSFRNAEMK